MSGSELMEWAATGEGELEGEVAVGLTELEMDGCMTVPGSRMLLMSELGEVLCSGSIDGRTGEPAVQPTHIRLCELLLTALWYSVESDDVGCRKGNNSVVSKTRLTLLCQHLVVVSQPARRNQSFAFDAACAVIDAFEARMDDRGREDGGSFGADVYTAACTVGAHTCRSVDSVTE